MENTKTIDDNLTTEFGLSAEIKGYLRETAKWAKFISIVGFVSVGLMIIGSISMGFFMGALGSELGGLDMPFPTALFSIVYLIVALIMAIPVWYLYKFASNMLLALRINDNQALADSFKNLKSHYKFYGIFVAIFLGFYALMLLLAVFGGLSQLL